MFKVGDIVEITEESSATGLLDFVDGKGYPVMGLSGQACSRGYDTIYIQQVKLKDESGRVCWYGRGFFKLKEKEEKKVKTLFKEGQVVWDLRNGRGVVEEITNDDRYPVKVRFDLNDMDGYELTDHYTADGRYVNTHTVRSLYFSEPKIEAATEPLFEPVLKENDMVYAVHIAGAGGMFSIAKELEHEVKTHCGEILVKTAWDFYRIGEKIEFN